MLYENVTTRKATVFLVDDDDLDAIAVERGFKKHKIVNPIVRAKNGMEALEMLRSFHDVRAPYVVLLDINMPKMDGLTLLKKIRDDDILAQSVVFILTTSDAEKDKFEAYNLNVAGYCLKQNSGNDFTNFVKMLDNFWRVVELPEIY
ncbi:response regulator [Aliiglaciecola lipolytica]|uniref:Probable response regulator n=1 Tax=Aliiglaciecola lipolytica E3 TaxID=1127673 RepID=K6YZQ0_9ALTE|nr:response regulator [Aliiglaciecola lipolytica]GAC16690.1 probable response regulator [Aliiglaciecola lipolytica E3]